MKKSIIFAIGELLSILAGFISFPILARYLSVSEYGVLALLQGALVLSVAFSKLGFPGSLVRFYYDKSMATDSLLSSITLACFGNAAMVAIILVSVSISGLFAPLVSQLLLVAVALVVSRALFISVQNTYRASGQATRYIASGLTAKYLSMLVGLTLLVVYDFGLKGYFIGFALTEALVLIVLFSFFCRSVGVSVRKFDYAIYKQIIHFGLPLFFVELVFIILSHTDKYVLLLFKGNQAVGFFALAYAIANYIQMVFNKTFSLIVVPKYNRLWNIGKRNETIEYLRRSAHVYLFFAIPVAIGSFVVSHDLVVVLASEKYAKSASIFPILLIGMLVFSAYHLSISGSMLAKANKSIVKYTLFVAVLNITMHFILIPQFGVYGAAISTLISYCVLMYLIVRNSRKHIILGVDWMYIAKLVLASAFMAGVIQTISIESLTVQLVARILIGGSIFLVIMMICHRELRRNVMGRLTKEAKT